ncbi:hypothetical protein PT2222_240024 [Paraburkholderia tropica]
MALLRGAARLRGGRAGGRMARLRADGLVVFALAAQRIEQHGADHEQHHHHDQDTYTQRGVLLARLVHVACPAR